jgi:hypothetical protein
MNASVVGMMMGLVGVLLLFRYGMPFHVETGGVTLISIEQVDVEEIKKEKVYKILGYIGIALVVVGTALQIKAAWT